LDEKGRGVQEDREVGERAMEGMSLPKVLISEWPLSRLIGRAKDKVEWVITTMERGDRKNVSAELEAVRLLLLEALRRIG